MNEDLSGPDYQMQKHSVLLDGHQTSVSLENAFWQRLKDIAKKQDVSLNSLVTSVDHARTTNLSSALRVFVLTQWDKG